MRLQGLLLGVRLAMGASVAHAAPPLDIARPGSHEVSRARALFTQLHRAPEVDRAEALTTTTGVKKVVVILLQFPDLAADTLAHSPEA